MSERDKLADRIRESMYVGHDTPGELADEVLDMGYVRVSTDPDTVDRVAEALHWRYCCDSEHSVAFDYYCRMARAAINAIGGGDE